VARKATEVAPALFEHLLKPLVLGGPVTLMRPLGAELEAAIAALEEPADAESLSQIEFARVRRVRALTPLDRCAPPSARDWRLLACLHDVLQASHPALSVKANRKLIASVGERIAAVLPVANAHEALMRHSLFARVLQIARVDTEVNYWVGSATYLGTPVPARLTAWPELRQVRTSVTRRETATLLGSDHELACLDLFLRKTPVTDFVTSVRTAPRFQFTEENCALLATPIGMKLAIRAVKRLPQAPQVLREAAVASARLQPVVTLFLQALAEH
jgi:hypothetical protein